MTETQKPLTAQTPREIDEQLAALDGAYLKLDAARDAKIERAHHLNGERKRYTRARRGEWPTTTTEVLEALALKLADEKIPAYDVKSVTEAIEAIDVLGKEMDANRKACEPFDAEYTRRPWARFFQVQDGHIHSGTRCQGGSIRNTTRVGWRPELSDKDAADAVAALGPLLCTKCFPSAPVEYTRGLEKTLAPGYCTGQGQRGADLQMQYASPRGKCPECGQKVGVTSLGKVRRHKLDTDK
jgi:hypothetical protein